MTAPTETTTSKGTLQLTHTRAEGTLVHGSSKHDGALDVLRACHGHWRPFRSLGCLGLLNTRDRAAKTYEIKRAAEALRAAGWEVVVDVDDTAPARDMAEAEAERAERAAGRVERFGGYAGNASQRAASTYERARQMADAIPLGQPMMPDHYSYNRDRRYRDRMHRTYERAFAEMGKAEHWEHRADAAEANQAHRESVPATLRRIAKLEADARRIERAMDVQQDWYWDRNPEHASYPVLFQSCGARRAKQQADLDDVNAQIAHWREHIEQSGQKVWGPADFAKGDYALRRDQWFQVLRVNAKSLSIPWNVNNGRKPVVTPDDSTYPRPIPYDDIQGRRSAEEMAAALADEAQPAI